MLQHWLVKGFGEEGYVTACCRACAEDAAEQQGMHLYEPIQDADPQDDCEVCGE